MFFKKKSKKNQVKESKDLEKVDPSLKNKTSYFALAGKTIEEVLQNGNSDT